MQITQLIIPAIVAMAVFLIYMVIVQSSNKEKIQQRIDKMKGDTIVEREKEKEAAEASEVYLNEKISPPAAVLSGILRVIGIDTESFRKREAMRFYRAGLQSPDAPVYYLFMKRIGVFGCVIFGALFAHTHEVGAMRMVHYIGGGLMIAMGFLGPDLYLKNRRTKREVIIQRSFPDALDLLLACVESGLALDGALARVCKELGRAYPEITEELNRTRLELTLLNDRTTALTNLAERTDMGIFKLLVTALLQSERFGTSLTETLRVLSEDARHTRLMLAEEKAGRLPVLMTIPLITLLLPALFIMILGPAILNVMKVMAEKNGG